MARTRRTKVRLWRWRRNPLRRRVDVVEAWVVLCAWVFAVVGGLLVGLVTAAVVTPDLQRQQLERREVTAVLTRDAPDQADAGVAGDERVWATVRWKAPDGSPRTGQTKVQPDSVAGARVTVWIDGRGALTAPPLSRAEVVLHAATAGTLAALGAGSTVLLSCWVVRGRLDRQRMRQWAVEWEQADLRWGGKTG